MSILVTGSKGYVGRALLREMERQGVACYAAGREQFELTDLDSIRAFFAGKDITHVIHLAGAVETKDPAALFRANIEGLYKLLCVCAENSVEHFLLASTNVVYGFGGDKDKKESDRRQPDTANSYALSKSCGELLAEDFCARHGIACAFARMSDIYGPGQKFGNLIKAVVSGAAKGEPLALYGEGTRTRDYIYIDDVAKGLLFICRSGLTGPVNLATGIGTSVRELVAIGVELGGGPVKQVPVENEEKSRIVLDVSLLKNAGFTAQTSIREGLKKCVMESRENERT